MGEIRDKFAQNVIEYVEAKKYKFSPCPSNMVAFLMHKGLIKENRELRVKQLELMKELQTFEQLYSYTKEIYRYTNLDLDLLKKEGTGYRYDVYNVTVGKLLEDNRGLRKEAMDSLNELIILKRQHDIMVTPEEMVRMEYLKERYEYYG